MHPTVLSKMTCILAKEAAELTAAAAKTALNPESKLNIEELSLKLNHVITIIEILRNSGLDIVVDPVVVSDYATTIIESLRLHPKQ